MTQQHKLCYRSAFTGTREAIPLVVPGLNQTRRPSLVLTNTNGIVGLHLTEDKPLIIPKHPIIITALTLKGSVKADNNCAVFSESGL